MYEEISRVKWVKAWNFFFRLELFKWLVLVQFFGYTVRKKLKWIGICRRRKLSPAQGFILFSIIYSPRAVSKQFPPGGGNGSVANLSSRTHFSRLCCQHAWFDVLSYVMNSLSLNIVTAIVVWKKMTDSPLTQILIKPSTQGLFHWHLLLIR